MRRTTDASGERQESRTYIQYYGTILDGRLLGQHIENCKLIATITEQSYRGVTAEQYIERAIRLAE